MKSFLQFISILIAGAIVVVGTTIAVNYFKKPLIIERPIDKPVLVQAPSCSINYADFLALTNKGQVVNLVQNLNTYAADGYFVNDKQVQVSRTGQGQIACGYLYVRARVNGRALDDRYESVYIKPQGFGGHLLLSKSIKIDNPIINTTEILLPLNSITYLPGLPYNPKAQNYNISDWAKLLNVSNKINFDIIGLSVEDSRAIIEDVKIVYKCWNPENGNGDETQDCQLSTL